MRIELLPNRRKAFVNNGFTEIPDADAGKYTINSLVSNRFWGGSFGKATTWDTENYRDTDIFGAEIGGDVGVNADGLYLILVSGVFDRLGGVNRAAATLQLYVNGSAVPIRCSHFIRRLDGHDHDETMMFAILRLQNGDDVQVYVHEESVGTASEGYYTGPDEGYTTQNCSFTIVRLNENNPYCMLSCSGTGADHQLTSDDSDTDMEWNVQTEIDSDYFGHSTSVNPDEITLKDEARYLVCYSEYWERLTDDTTRTGVYERLQLNGSDVPGSWSNNYLRGSQNGESILKLANCAMTLIETTSANQVLKLVAAREAGAITCERKSSGSSIMIYRLHGNEETFSIGSNSTENLGSTTPMVPDFSSIDWIDSNFSLSSDEVTVTGDKTMLFGGGVLVDNGSTDRVGIRWTLRVNGTELSLFAGQGYQRNLGDMNTACPMVAGIGTPSDGQAIGLYNASMAANGTTNYRNANTGRFWGINIDTL